MRRDMAIPGSPELPTTDAIRSAMDKRAKMGRGHAIAWALFVLIGIPCALLVILTPLTYSGVYIDALKPFWRPWPPDLAKPFIGLALFLGTFAYLVYRSGRLAGFHSGTVAATAAYRNLVEARRVTVEPEVSRATMALAIVDPAPPPGESSRPSPPPPEEQPVLQEPL